MKLTRLTMCPDEPTSIDDPIYDPNLEKVIYLNLTDQQEFKN